MKNTTVGVIGVGYLGRFHALKYAAMEEVDLAGVVDVDYARAQAVAEETGTKAYSNYREIMDSLDAVSISVPTTMHEEIAIPFLERGIGVLLEKPMAHDLEAGRRIMETASRNHALLQIGHLERFNPALLRLSDDIKDPMFIEAHRISPFNERGSDVDVFLDIMIHDIDIILSLVASRISSVETVGVPVLTDQVDIANTRIRFESGCIANITASRVSADVMRKIRIFQNNAYISIDFSGHSVDVYTLSQDHRIQHAGHHISESDALAAEIRSFIDALTGSGNIIVDGKAGLRAMEVAFMIKNAMINP